MVGAVLTQNTTWSNVEKALNALRAAKCLDPRAMHELEPEALADLIRPAGFFRVKTQRLHNLLDWLKNTCNYNLARLRNQEMTALRSELLGVNGIGPETADSILCYALGYPSFVVDAYTRRIFSRHGMVSENVEYEELRSLFMDALPPDTATYNEYHALLVRVAKQWCRKNKMLCESCPLNGFDKIAL
jgi:endonuclease-3 related protein